MMRVEGFAERFDLAGDVVEQDVLLALEGVFPFDRLPDGGSKLLKRRGGFGLRGDEARGVAVGQQKEKADEQQRQDDRMNCGPQGMTTRSRKVSARPGRLSRMKKSSVTSPPMPPAAAAPTSLRGGGLLICLSGDWFIGSSVYWLSGRSRRRLSGWRTGMSAPPKTRRQAPRHRKADSLFTGAEGSTLGNRASRRWGRN